ncbi:YbaK/prolyl-tRNA_synthetases associated domain-containing protein [Hexamita inflata]|uniref:YbaK/prolyl-tRNA synthetases associated domain-containing protein n=1 Tax=Hexamita inflata TaxID=28002 RepID=A0AA86P5Z8_9EUKA|nr:YbaK/prolyl-tRNA synthetases associated domain-containing protein [Hexamita inflata]
MQEIEHKIQKICNILQIPNDDQLLNAYAQSYKRGLKLIICAKVDDTYYKQSLQQRQQMIGSPCQNINQLTKCLLYENRVAPKENRNIEFSRFYLVIYQYTRKFSEPKFSFNIKQLKNQNPEMQHLTKSNYKLSFAEEVDAQQLCSAEHNGMSPIGLTDMNIPVILDSNIKEEYIFVGGLDPLVKTRVSVKELLKCFNSYVFEVSDELGKSESAE